MHTSETLQKHENYVEQLHEQGFITIDFPVTNGDMETFFSKFGELMHEVYDAPGERSEDIILAFRNDYPGRPHDSRGFIEQRRIGHKNNNEIGRSPGTDNKDILHWTPRTPMVAHEYMRTRGGMPKTMAAVINMCVELHADIKNTVRPVFRALGVEDIMLAPKGREIEDIHLLRPIHYLGSKAVEAGIFKAQDALAELHYDRSKFTWAGWESTTGLVGAPGHNGFRKTSLTPEDLDRFAANALANPIKHTEGQAKIFAGAGYNRLPIAYRKLSGESPLLLHGVIDDNPGDPRDAFVGFMNEHGGVTKFSAPRKHETGFSDVRTYVASRQRQLLRKALSEANITPISYNEERLEKVS